MWRVRILPCGRATGPWGEKPVLSRSIFYGTEVMSTKWLLQAPVVPSRHRSQPHTHIGRNIYIYRNAWMSHVRSHLPNVHPLPITHTDTHPHTHPTPFQSSITHDHATVCCWKKNERPLMCVCVCVCSWATSINKRQKQIITHTHTRTHTHTHTHTSRHSPPPSLQIHAGTNCHTWRFDIPTSASRRMRGEKNWRVEAEAWGGGTTESKKRMDGRDDDNPFSPQQRRIIYIYK